MLRYYGSYGIVNLSKDCPTKLKEIGTPRKTKLHYVEIIEEPEENERIPLRIVTRAQAQKHDPQQLEIAEVTKKIKKKTRRKVPNKTSSPVSSPVEDNQSKVEEQ